MKLNKILLGALLAVGVTNVAMAANSVTFNGTITAQTCSVGVNGTSGSATVTLPKIGTADLGAVGSTAGAENFNVTVTGCTSSGSNLNTALYFTAHGTDSTNLKNTGTATGVGVQLLDGGAGGTALDFTSGQATASTDVLASGATGYSHKFAAQYYADGAIGVGNVIAVADYQVIYP